MNAILVDFGMGLSYRCDRCFNRLEYLPRESHVFRHPTEVDDGLFFKKLIPIRCPHAGKEVQNPNREIGGDPMTLREAMAQASLEMGGSDEAVEIRASICGSKYPGRRRDAYK